MRGHLVQRHPVVSILEALGQGYHFKETGGVQMDFTVTSRADIEKLSVERVVERLGYVDKALRMLRRRNWAIRRRSSVSAVRRGRSPTSWWKARSVPKYSRALQLFREDPQDLSRLHRGKIDQPAVTAYLADADRRRRGRRADFRQPRRPSSRPSVNFKKPAAAG